MGAWGVGPLENDFAADIECDIEDSEDLSTLINGVLSKYNEGAYIEADLGSESLALGALLVGVDLEDESEHAAASRLQECITPEQRSVLKQLVTETLYGGQSELAELWGDEGQLEAWQETSARILQRWPESKGT